MDLVESWKSSPERIIEVAFYNGSGAPSIVTVLEHSTTLRPVEDHGVPATL